MQNSGSQTDEMPGSATQASVQWTNGLDVPLCVDLDGTLLRVDSLQESIAAFVGGGFWRVFLILIWWGQGRAYLKSRLAKLAPVTIGSLPVTKDFLRYLISEHRSGRRLVLVTGADIETAKAASVHFGIFDEVLASDGRINLVGKKKAEELVKRFGAAGFDYAGNSRDDLAVWKVARERLYVNAASGLRKAGGQQFGQGAHWLSAWKSALRPHQWSKNLLVLIPAIAGHKVTEAAVLRNTGLGIAAFCACASAVYILNDLMDLSADREHPTKWARPFASGDLSPAAGLAVAVWLLMCAGAIGLLLPTTFLVVLGLYFVTSLLYSAVIKKLLLLDVFALAGLYSLRILGGHGATEIRYSSWLLGFSMFLFLSLALVKRYVELHRVELSGRMAAAGRSYLTTDLPLLISLGPLSGWLAVLVLALYINSPEVQLLYHHPLRLLLVCPLLLYWVSRVWLLAKRDLLHDDPVVFALKDPTSYAVGIVTAVIVWLATI